MKKIGVFGGTFNPVHRGHEMIAKEFYDKFGIDKLLIMPTFITPKKTMDDSVSPYQRLEMCRIAFNSDEYRKYNIEVSDMEIKKGGRSYSYDTITSLCEIYNKRENIIYFLVGTDMFLTIENWYKYEELLNLCVFTVAYRLTSDYEDEARKNEITEKINCLIRQGKRIEILENCVFELSSTELRESIKNGAAYDDYLNKDVSEYIRRENLYM